MPYRRARPSPRRAGRVSSPHDQFAGILPAVKNRLTVIVSPCEIVIVSARAVGRVRIPFCPFRDHGPETGRKLTVAKCERRDFLTPRAPFEGGG